MTRPGYIKVPNDIGGSQEAVELADEAYLPCLGLYVLLLGYCDRQRTDGHVPGRALSRVIAPGQDCSHLMAELVGAGFLEAGDDGWTIPSYLDWQRSRAEIEGASESARKAARRRWGHATRNAEGNADGNATRTAECTAECTAESNADGNATRNAECNAPNQPTRQPTRGGSAALMEDPQKSEDPLTAEARRIPCWEPREDDDALFATLRRSYPPPQIARTLRNLEMHQAAATGKDRYKDPRRALVSWLKREDPEPVGQAAGAVRTCFDAEGNLTWVPADA